MIPVPKSEFTRNVLKIFSGTALANVISFLALPVLTRLFSQQDLGNFQLFLSTITTFSVISALKYELAVVLPKEDRDANDLILLSLSVLVLFSAAVGLILFLFGAPLLDRLSAPVLKPYIVLIFAGIFLMGLVQTLQYVLIRHKRYGELARNKIVQIGATQAAAIGLGILHPSFVSLAVAQMAGLAAAAFLVLRTRRINFSDSRVSRLRTAARRYAKFPAVNTPSVFTNTLALQLPVFMFKRFFSADVVGLYMVAQRLVSLPLNLIGRSVYQVYFQAASEAYHHGADALYKVYKETVLKLGLLALAPIAVILLLAPSLVRVFLGAEWGEAGVYMQIITFWSFFQFINMPISSTFTIINRQEIGFILITLSLAVRFFAMLLFHDTPREMLFALSISAGLFYLVYNLSVAYFVKRAQ